MVVQELDKRAHLVGIAEEPVQKEQAGGEGPLPISIGVSNGVVYLAPCLLEDGADLDFDHGRLNPGRREFNQVMHRTIPEGMLVDHTSLFFKSIDKLLMIPFAYIGNRLFL